MKVDYSLCIVAGGDLLNGKSISDTIEQAILGGCTMVQLREKFMSTRSFYEQALAVKYVTDKYGVPLIINDSVDIAIAVNAAGVHLGQNDLPADAARRIIPKNMILGISVTSAEEARAAEKSCADYIGVGAIFPTETKSDAEYVSMMELRRIREAVSVPIVVIGGIDMSNAGLFRPMGINGVAVASAILTSKDIQKASKEIKKYFEDS